MVKHHCLSFRFMVWHKAEKDSTTPTRWTMKNQSPASFCDGGVKAKSPITREPGPRAKKLWTHRNLLEPLKIYWNLLDMLRSFHISIFLISAIHPITRAWRGLWQIELQHWSCPAWHTNGFRSRNRKKYQTTAYHVWICLGQNPNTHALCIL